MGRDLLDELFQRAEPLLAAVVLPRLDQLAQEFQSFPFADHFRYRREDGRPVHQTAQDRVVLFGRGDDLVAEMGQHRRQTPMGAAFGDADDTHAGSIVAGGHDHVAQAGVGDLQPLARAMPEVDVGAHRGPAEERPELLEPSLLILAAGEAAHLAGQRVAGDELLTPEVLLRPVAAEVLDQGCAVGGIAGEDQPLDLLAHHLGFQIVVHVDGQVVRALEAGLHREAVDRLAVFRTEQADPDPAGRDVAQPHVGTGGEEKDTLLEEHGALDRREHASPIAVGHALVEDDHVVPAVFPPRLRVDRDRHGGAEPAAEAGLEPLDGSRRAVTYVRQAAEQAQPFQHPTEPTVACGMRRAVFGQESEQRFRQPDLLRAGVGLHAGRLGHLEEVLDLGLREIPLTQRGAGLGIEHFGIAEQEAA